ncbi:MAG: ABC transporter substrate binding protein [Pyrinomonadaceae bacterium]
MRTLAQGLLLALVLVASCATSVAAQDAVEHKRVLIILTNDSFTATQATIERALRSTLKDGSPVPVETYSEYVGNTRADTDYEKEFVALLRRKYEGKKFDLIFSIGRFPTNIILRNSDALFPGTPIVFLVIDQRLVTGLPPAPNLTGVWGEINFKPNLELALALHPGTKRVAVIQGVSETDKDWAARAREDFRAYESRLEFIYLTGLPPEEMRKVLGGLPHDTIVFFVSSVRDTTGNVYESPEYLRQVSTASAAPIYGTTEALLGAGIVGGELLSFEALGVEGGRVGLRVLAGEKPEAIAPHAVPGVAMFDWHELTRWGVSEERLPPGSVVRFKVPTFWEEYRGRIAITLSIVALQAGFIAALLIERKRRRRSSEALDQLNTQLEQRIAARTAALDKKSRELETFAYSVAHDLKTPLRSIDGYSRLLIEDYSADLTGEARSFLETISTSTEEMSQLIDDLLAYSRIERREFKPDRLELQPLIARLVEQKRHEAAERGIEFVVKVNGGIVMADANGLVQSLRNYLDNAVKFTREVAQPRIEVGAKETTTSCLLWVGDNGIGFDSKYHDKIFGIFQRLNHAEDYPGTGIGLAIVRKAMERMDGRAWAESSPGRGATFYLEIPKTNRGGGD